MQTLTITFFDKTTKARSTYRAEGEFMEHEFGRLLKKLLRVDDNKVDTSKVERISMVLEDEVAEEKAKGSGGKVIKLQRDASLPFIKTCKCPECNNMIIANVELGEEFTCNLCNTDLTFPSDPDVYKPASYVCVNCGTKGYIAVTDETKDDIRCKQCKSPIDFMFHDKKGIYMSPNMIK